MTTHDRNPLPDRNPTPTHRVTSCDVLEDLRRIHGARLRDDLTRCRVAQDEREVWLETTLAKDHGTEDVRRTRLDLRDETGRLAFVPTRPVLRNAERFVEELDDGDEAIADLLNGPVARG